MILALVTVLTLRYLDGQGIWIAVIAFGANIVKGLVVFGLPDTNRLRLPLLYLIQLDGWLHVIWLMVLVGSVIVYRFRHRLPRWSIPRLPTSLPAQMTAVVVVIGLVSGLHRANIGAQNSPFPCLGGLPEARDWLALQLWARANTPQGTIFVNPPDMWGFEGFSQRGQIISVIEMGLSLYTEATFWEEIERTRAYGVDPLNVDFRGKSPLTNALREAYESFDEKDFCRMQHEFDASYAIVRSGKSPSPTPVYTNDHFTVFAIECSLRTQ